MTIEADFFALLGPLVASRVYPVEFPQAPTAAGSPEAPRWPAIRVFLVDSSPVQDLCGDGEEETDEIRYQLDIVSHREAGYSAHRALVRQVRAAMAGFPTPARIESTGDEPLDYETMTFRSRIDYVIHGSTTT